MTTIELEAYKAEVAREVLNTDSRAVLEKVQKLLSRERKKATEDLTPYTMEEINARIERSRANIKAGRVHTTEEVRRMIENRHPWLCE